MTRLRSITWRLTLLFVVVSVVALSAVATLVGVALYRHFEDQDAEELHGKLAFIEEAVMAADRTGDASALPAQMRNALAGHPDLSLAVFASDGHVLFKGGPVDLTAAMLKRADAMGRGMAIWTIGGRSYHGVLAATNIDPARDALRPEAPATVALALDLEHHLEFLRAYGRTVLASIVFGVGLAAVLGWFAVRRGLRPLDDIARRTGHVSAQALGERLEVDAYPAELAGLVSSLNAMMMRLEDAFERLSAFSADIAHELRTPINTVLMQTQVALSKERSAEQYREVLYSSLEEYERLARTVSDMLFLAKAENGLMVPNRVPIALDEEIDALFDFYDALAEQQSIKLVRHGDARLMGDPLMLRRALSNLISNAIRHGRAGQPVAVELGHDERGLISISVVNQGETIAPEHLERLFDRFYRADLARQRDSEGAGLGLAITRSIIEAHGGSIRARSADGRTRFEITLPDTNAAARERSERDREPV